MKDQFANYVVQKVLETCDDQQRELILSRIKVHLSALKKYTYGKHIVARVEKLVAAGGIYSSFFIFVFTYKFVFLCASENFLPVLCLNTHACTDTYMYSKKCLGKFVCSFISLHAFMLRVQVR